MKEIAKPLSNQKGMSLATVMIAVAITAINGFAISQAIVQLKRLELLSEMNVDAQGWLRGIEMVMTNPKSCSLTLMNASAAQPIDQASLRDPNSLPVNEIREADGNDPQGKIFSKAGDDLFSPSSNSRLIFERAALTLDATTPPLTPDSHGKAQLKFFLRKKQTKSVGGDYFVRTLNVLVSTDGDAKIVGCSVVDDARINQLTKALCESIGGQYSTATAKCNLEKSEPLLNLVCDAFGFVGNTSTFKCNATH